MTDKSLHSDKTFWTTLKWPAAPNDDDYSVYEQHCQGRVLLLGSTKKLLPLCTQAWDLEPNYNDPRIIDRDWLTLDQHWDTIIGDAVLCFTKEFAEQLLPVLLTHADRVVLRSFLNPNWKTTYAKYFPRVNDLSPQPEEIPINDVYTFYLWNKNP